jgi:hypothetical protein
LWTWTGHWHSGKRTLLSNFFFSTETKEIITRLSSNRDTLCYLVSCTTEIFAANSWYSLSLSLIEILLNFVGNTRDDNILETGINMGCAQNFTPLLTICHGVNIVLVHCKFKKIPNCAAVRILCITKWQLLQHLFPVQDTKALLTQLQIFSTEDNPSQLFCTKHHLIGFSFSGMLLYRLTTSGHCCWLMHTSKACLFQVWSISSYYHPFRNSNFLHRYHQKRVWFLVSGFGLCQLLILYLCNNNMKTRKLHALIRASQV